MNKEQLLRTCHQLIKDMEQELTEQDLGEALEDALQVLTNIKTLEAEIDILSPAEEEKLEAIIQLLTEIDVDKVKSTKEVIEVVDQVQGLLTQFRNKVLLGKSDEVWDILAEVKKLLKVITEKVA